MSSTVHLSLADGTDDSAIIEYIDRDDDQYYESTLSPNIVWLDPHKLNLAAGQGAQRGRNSLITPPIKSFDAMRSSVSRSHPPSR